MFISVLDLFKVGIGPSSSHTMGPMTAALDFRLNHIMAVAEETGAEAGLQVRCTLRGSLAYTGKGHATDVAVMFGLHGYAPQALLEQDINALAAKLRGCEQLSDLPVIFRCQQQVVFDKGPALAEHPNGMVFDLLDGNGDCLRSQTYFSIGGGFVHTREEMGALAAPLKMVPVDSYPYAFDSAASMLRMCEQSGSSIAGLKRANELKHMNYSELNAGLDRIWEAMCRCLENGLAAEGQLPGELKLSRRAKQLYEALMKDPQSSNLNEWLCAYAMAVNEENAAGHMVVTAPTNGGAGVIPAVLYFAVFHEGFSLIHIREFLLTAAAIGGIIKHRGSISGAEVGCQGEVGSAAAMAAAGLCAIRGGSPYQVENAAEIALEHHLGMTCDPVAGLVQVPCIERNGFGAVKAVTAASLAIRGSGHHFMPLDNCIAAMRQTGMEMSVKFKETSLGGLAVSLTEC